MDVSAEPQFLVVGRIIRPHGVQGEVRVEPYSDEPGRFERLERVYVGQQSPILWRLEGVRYHQDAVLLKLEGCGSRDDAEKLRGQWLQIPEAEAAPLAEGEYYLHQLIDLLVYTDDGRLLGRLSEVLETGANNVFVVKGDAGEILLPDIPDVIRDIDFDNGTMTVRLLPGLPGADSSYSKSSD